MNNQVNVFNKENFSLENFPNLSLAILNQTLKTTAKKYANCEVAVIFINEKLSLYLNQTYRKKDYIADVLSFGNEDQQEVVNQDLIDLGDIYICYPKAKNQAEIYQHSLIRELSFLFLHGLLHNLGYDHQTPKEEKIMFSLQKNILNDLKIFRK